METTKKSVLEVPGRDKLIIYLDFDGVLHPELTYFHPEKGPYIDPAIHGHTLFEHAEMLAELLAPFPDVRIVLSTSWTMVRGFGKALSYLPRALQNRAIGATYHSEMNADEWSQMARGYQILSDASRRRPRRWVALDDDYKDWPSAHKKKLIRTHGMHGISHPGIAEQLQKTLQDWHCQDT